MVGRTSGIAPSHAGWATGADSQNKWMRCIVVVVVLGAAIVVSSPYETYGYAHKDCDGACLTKGRVGGGGVGERLLL